MSDNVTITLIGASVQLVGLYLTYRKVGKVHHEMNSMREQLVDSARIEGHAAGVKEEKASQKLGVDIPISGIKID